MFTIDAEDNLYHQYRLQQCGQWRSLEKGAWAFSEGDLLYKDFVDTVSHSTQESLVELGGKLFMANPKILELGMEYANVFVRAHHSQRPRKFSRPELEQLIREGDDSRLNVLVLAVDGRFSLMDAVGVDLRYHPVAVRHEAWCEGNGYVGPEAAADTSHVSETYVDMLQGWLEHLQTGRMDVFVDMPASLREAELWEKVEALYE